MPRLIDLSHPTSDGQLGFPGDPKIEIQAAHTVDSIGYNLSQLKMSSHQGTHLDAPFHFFNDGKTLDQINLDRFYGTATVIDLAPQSALPLKTELTVERFEPFAEKFQPGAKILYRTGWDVEFGKESFFTDFPTLTLEAAQWIADRKIGLLGMDTPTPSQQWLKCHHILLNAKTEIVIVESLKNLDQLPDAFTFIGFPLNIQGGDGSPIRAVALID